MSPAFATPDFQRCARILTSYAISSLIVLATKLLPVARHYNGLLSWGCQILGVLLALVVFQARAASPQVTGPCPKTTSRAKPMASVRRAKRDCLRRPSRMALRTKARRNIRCHKCALDSSRESIVRPVMPITGCSPPLPGSEYVRKLAAQRLRLFEQNRTLCRELGRMKDRNVIVEHVRRYLNERVEVVEAALYAKEEERRVVVAERDSLIERVDALMTDLDMLVQEFEDLREASEKKTKRLEVALAAVVGKKARVVSYI